MVKTDTDVKKPATDDTRDTLESSLRGFLLDAQFDAIVAPLSDDADEIKRVRSHRR